jgi:hypothetical protein
MLQAFIDVGATGFEPVGDFDGSGNAACACEFCQGYRAARALHSGRFNCLNVASLDPDLQRVITAWDALPEAMRTVVIALVGVITVPPAALPSPVENNREPRREETA